jgi:hypothetical protein
MDGDGYDVFYGNVENAFNYAEVNDYIPEDPNIDDNYSRDMDIDS